MTDETVKSPFRHQFNEAFQPLVDELAAKRRAIIPDLPVGIGKHQIFLAALGQGGAKKCLVIGHAVELQGWASEIGRFDPQSKVQLLRKVEAIDPEANWVVTSPPVAAHAVAEIAAGKFDACVIDIAPVPGQGFFAAYGSPIAEALKSVKTVWLVQQAPPEQNAQEIFPVVEALRRHQSEEPPMSPSGG